MPPSTQPTVNPFRTSQPPFAFSGLLWEGTSTSGDFLSADAAWSSAYSTATTNRSGASPIIWPNPMSEGIGYGSIQKYTPTLPAPPYYSASVSLSSYQLKFATPSCYLQFWWDEVLTTNPGGSTAITSKNFVWDAGMSVAGLCLPSDFVFDPHEPPYLPSQITNWPESPIYTVELTQPSGGDFSEVIATIENPRYSFLPSYTPPSDGSANGFPA